VKEVFLEVDGLKLRGEIYPPQGEGPFPVLCLCHGIPARPPDPSDPGYRALAERFSQEGFLSFIFNFRGAGESEGNLDLLGWTRDLGAVLDWLGSLEEVDQARVSVMGFSGGAAVAVYVAAHDTRVKSVVACACPAEFTFSPEEMLRQAREVGTIRDPDFPPSFEEWAQGLKEVSPIRFIDRISPRPLLILHGESDELIDPSQALRLYEKAREPKEFILIHGAGHRLRLSREAMEAAARWLKRVNRMVRNEHSLH